MGRRKGRPGLSPEERKVQQEICRAINEADLRQRQKIYQDMERYRQSRERINLKAREARAAGLSYGYYVALVLEKRGNLDWSICNEEKSYQYQC
jgi:hypothetical protein